MTWFFSEVADGKLRKCHGGDTELHLVASMLASLQVVSSEHILTAGSDTADIMGWQQGFKSFSNFLPSFSV